jgi:xanthine/CO dehydrogenase XdhC/CoxF family maturation factor
VTAAWLGVLERGEPAVLVTRLSGPSGRRVVLPSLPSVGILGDAALGASADAAARDRLALACPVSSTDTCNGVELFLEVNQPPPDLVIFGAGQDAVPLVQQAWLLGFNVTVADPRSAYLQSDLFGGARLVLTGFEDLGSALRLPRGAFVVIMNHHLDRDRRALRFAFERDPAYIGVLGPRGRYEKLLATLANEGHVPPAATRDRVHSPIGLAIGAETAEEVAVAILAEILAIRRGFAGGFLTGSTGSLHRPAERRAVARS